MLKLLILAIFQMEHPVVGSDRQLKRSKYSGQNFAPNVKNKFDEIEASKVIKQFQSVIVRSSKLRTIPQ